MFAAQKAACLEKTNESNSINQKALCALQDRETQGQAVCDLQQP
jgi:hypothetical protein